MYYMYIYNHIHHHQVSSLHVHVQLYCTTVVLTVLKYISCNNFKTCGKLPDLLYSNTPTLRIFPWVVTRKRTINSTWSESISTSNSRREVPYYATSYSIRNICRYYWFLSTLNGSNIFIDYCPLLLFIYKIVLLNWVLYWNFIYL